VHTLNHVLQQFQCFSPWPLSFKMVSTDALSPNQPRRSAIRWRLPHSGHLMMTTPDVYACLLKLRIARLSAEQTGRSF
jgi:hypothetical protein